MASGWNLWVWLPCIGVVSGCCCKEVYTVEPPLTDALNNGHLLLSGQRRGTNHHYR